MTPGGRRPVALRQRSATFGVRLVPVRHREASPPLTPVVTHRSTVGFIRRLTATVTAGVLLGVSGGVAIGLISPPAAHADTVRGLQWWLDPLKVRQAHKVAKGGGVTVAVIDTGVDAAHPDLKGAVLPGTGMLGSTSAKGWDDPTGHGTGIASIIAARGGSGANQMLGIAPEAKILPIAVPAPFSGTIARPVRYAVDHGAKIINMSFGGKGAATQEEIDAIAWARSKGVIVVAAGGNTTQGDDHVPHPGSYPGVITVNGTDRAGNLWSGSLHDNTMDIAAPAEDIISAKPRALSSNTFGVSSGTSDATAMVSGALALIWSKYPKLDAANVVNRLLATAVDKGQAGRDDQFGNGLIDILAAVTAEVPAVTVDPLGPVTIGTAAAPADGGDTGSGSADFGTPAIRTTIVAGVALVLLTAVVLAIILPARAINRRRQREAVAAAGYGRLGAFGPPSVSSPPGASGPPGAFGYPRPEYLPPAGYPTGPVTGQQPPVGQFPGGNPPTSPTGFRPGGTAQFPATGQPPAGQPPASTTAFPATGTAPQRFRPPQ